MNYIIYKTTNTINGKFYIGKHKTNDLNDGYIGSGKLLKRAIKKYGIDNFHKEIIHNCSSEKEMNLLEKILVVPDSELNYNLCSGGQGGFGYINETKTKEDYASAGRLGAVHRKGKKDPLWSEKLKQLHAEGKIKTTAPPSRKGSKLSKEHKEKLNASRRGKAPWNKGRSHSPETKMKIANSKKNQSQGGSAATAPLL